MYETQVMTFEQMQSFTAGIDQKIGVDYEINKLDLNEYYVVVMDLETNEEIQICRKLDLKEVAQ